MTRMLRALVIAFCAGDEFFLTRIRAQHVVLKAEKYASELPIFFNLSVRTTVVVMEYFPVLYRFRRFSRLSIERQLAVMEAWENNRFALIRNAFKLIKVICVTQILNEHKLLTSIGYGDVIQNRVKRKGPGR